MIIQHQVTLHGKSNLIRVRSSHPARLGWNIEIYFKPPTHVYIHIHIYIYIVIYKYAYNYIYIVYIYIIDMYVYI